MTDRVVMSRPEGAWGRLSEVAAGIATRGLAGVFAGIVVLGVGGRIVMYLSRLLHPGAVGSLTEGGNRVGEFTFGGTIGLILFGGLAGGLLVGMVWAVTQPWLPDRPAVVGFAAALIGSFALIDSENIDFVILRNPYFDVLLLIGLVFALGATVARTDRWLESRLPHPSRSRGWRVTSGVVALLGLSVLFGPPAIFFSRDACCAEPPVATGVFLIVVGIATAWTWIDRVRGASPSSTARRLGQGATWLAVAAGGAHLARELIQLFA